MMYLAIFGGGGQGGASRGGVWEEKGRAQHHAAAFFLECLALQPGGAEGGECMSGAVEEPGVGGRSEAPSVATEGEKAAATCCARHVVWAAEAATNTAVEG